jgi:alpha-1,2-mannosyltransferase
MMLHAIKRLSTRAVIAWCIAGVLAQALVHAHHRRWFSDAPHDFTGFYVGGRLVGTSSLYDPKDNLAVQSSVGIQPRDFIIFVRLPYFALLLKPLASLPYRAAVLVWKALIVLALVLFACLFPYGSARVRWIALCWFVPAGDAFVMGQDSPFVILWVALALRLRMTGAFFVSGLLFSLSAEKWHLLMLLPVALVLLRDWRTLAGLISGWVVLVGSGFLIQGPTFLTQYYRALTLPNMNAIPMIMPSFMGLSTILNTRGIYYAGLALTLTAMWRVARLRSFERTLAIVLTFGALIAPHSYVHDWTFALPGLILLAVKESVTWPIPVISFTAIPLAYDGIPIGALFLALCGSWLVIDRGWALDLNERVISDLRCRTT